GALVAVLGAGFALLIENDPRDRGLRPDGDRYAELGSAPHASLSGTARPLQDFSVRDAITSRAFVGLYAACLICSFGAFVPFVHLVPYALDRGITQSSAVLLLGMIGVGSTVGRFFLGGLADRMGRRASLLAMFVGMALSLAIWAVAGNLWTLAVFAFA